MKESDFQLMHPRDQIVLIITRIYQRGLTTTSGGNISIMDESGDLWVTPSAIDKGSLNRDDIIQVKKDGSIIGKHKPSSEYPFHKAIYEIRPDIKAVIHAHPPALVSFSIVRQIPDTNVIPQAKNICSSVGYAPYALPGSEELGERIAGVFREGHKAVIMENHGTVVGGSNLDDAFQRFETLEFTARAIINGKTIGKVKSLSDSQINAFEEQIPHLSPEMEKVEGTSVEQEKREEIVRFVKRACQQGLMISSYGTVSRRWKGNDFLITPTNMNRWDMTPDDVVQIKNGEREPGKIPSRSTWLHQELYKRHPHINSIILTQSPYLMAFSVTGNKFDVRTIPESWIFLQDVPNVSFGSHFKGNDTVPDLITESVPAVIIDNDSVIVTGDTLLGTFDRLEVAEFSAKSLVMATSLGKLAPIGQSEVDELRKKFLS
ncbi:class II aldolase/adducin family protein [Prolixibacter sp. SD074]|uniref:class II aldolase/adducin family protein n=1 Tax=Prolixibacter sp. SD074 TaxID=2652391 RepID=UPI001298F79C|nr:class II aldolase/adducin family protein [Prolixibacter sp. SD074]